MEKFANEVNCTALFWCPYCQFIILFHTKLQLYTHLTSAHNMYGVAHQPLEQYLTQYAKNTRYTILAKTNPDLAQQN